MAQRCTQKDRSISFPRDPDADVQQRESCYYERKLDGPDEDCGSPQGVRKEPTVN